MTPFSYIENKVYTQIRPSKIQGVGVFAMKDIPKGVDPFEPWEGESGRYPVTEKMLASLDRAVYKHVKDIFLYNPDFPSNTDTYVTLTKGCHWIYTTPYYFVNSSESKYNIDKDTFRVTRDIKAGEELLSNYGRYERLDKSLL